MNEKLKSTLKYLVYILILSLAISAIFGAFVEQNIGNVAMIKVDGIIMSQGTSTFGTQVSTSEDIVKFIEEADKNEAIKAIIVEINSPGGTPVASAEIADALKAVNKTKVAWIREVGASGAYWVASSTDVIVAHPLSITGSIGVLGSYLEFSGLMQDYNVSYERFVYGKYKDLGTPYKKLSDDEKSLLQSKIDKIGEYFIAEVAKNRNMPVEKVKELATGEFYLGEEAKNLGLIDELGGKEKAYEIVKQKTNITSVEPVVYEKKQTFLDAIASLVSEHGFFVGKGISSSLTQQKFEVTS